MNFAIVVLVLGFIGGSIASFKLENKREQENQNK
jgi:hypothetical protein